ncbi:hypothetical protein E4U43_005835 [Claviceps pusilla]|uniref:Endo-1,4-beta-xylanase n=1 Tax=Claviceps pusilla TaxID=123648 RepID=A0A9P7T020_9HYPO|nr:hypothetical protein E4U43_005835 [Claviceps pusilla]
MPIAPARSVSYSVKWSSDGNSYLAVYGWFDHPLAEFYILENFSSRDPSKQGQNLSQVTADGSIYDIYVSKRINKPSIRGKASFEHFWSIRRDERIGGTISTDVHMDAWSSAGLLLGTVEYMLVAVEGFQSSGNASITVH